MPVTQRGRYRFAIKEGEGDRFFIAAEPAGERIEKLGDDVLCFDLRPGASQEQARVVADFQSCLFETVHLPEGSDFFEKSPNRGGYYNCKEVCRVSASVRPSGNSPAQVSSTQWRQMKSAGPAIASRDAKKKGCLE
jgi:hypothetical protein